MATQPRGVISSDRERSAGGMPVFLLTWCLIVLLACLAVRATRAPQPKPATAPQEEFSAERALVHVRHIASVPHPIGSKANTVVRDYLLAQLEQLGLHPQVFSALGVNAQRSIVSVGRTNDIVGRLPGSAGNPAIMLMAHYDSVSRAPGAADDGAAVASILETVRALRHGPALKRDLIVLFTDGEEAGLLGAEAFAHSHPWVPDIGLILNFDARGNRGPSLLFETSANNRPLLEAVSRAAPDPVGSSLFYELYKLLPNDTDFTVFLPLRIPGLNFAFGEGLEGYHTPLDTPDDLSLASLQHHGSYQLALTRYFGQSDLIDLKKSQRDDVFFDWFGSSLIAYSQGWVLPGQILVTISVVLALLLALRHSQVKIAKVLLGLLACLLFLIIVPLVAALGWWIASFFLAGRTIIGDASANLFLLSGLIFLGAGAGTLLLSIFSRRFGNLELSLAGLQVWWVLSCLVALALPSASYLLFWPLLLASAGSVISQLSSQRGRRTPAWMGNLAGAAATVLLFAPVIYLAYVFLTLQLITVVASAFLLGLFFLISFPLLQPGVAIGREWGVASLAIAALVCLVSGALRSHYTLEHPREDSIVYSLNADDHTAKWISYDSRPDAWTTQFLGEKPQPQHVTSYLAGLQRPLLSAAAPALQLPSPIIENVDQKIDGNLHKLRLTIRSVRNADSLYLRFPEDIQMTALTVAGREIRVLKGGRSGLNLFGMGGEGVDLQITVKTSSPVSFWLMDRSSGLPLETQPRPGTIMGPEGSDVTFVCRKYTL